MTTMVGTEPPAPDVALVLRMARGDEEAAHRLVRAHGDSLLRFVIRRTRNLEDAEEIVQDTFVAAIRMGDRYDGSCTVFTWLCSLARLKITDHLKSESRLKRSAHNGALRLDDESRALLRSIHAPEASLETIVDKLDHVRLVQALLDSMSPEQREAVALRYIEQFSIAEIATIMSRSEKAVERLLERAKDRPRHEMFRWFGNESFRIACYGLVTL
jgi:RNA polymerase sigma-70 factor (ECF subfamily)